MKRENEYIISESREIVEGEDPDWIQHIRSAFPAFSHRNYRIYFTGNLISLIGTWLQQVAQGYLVYEITNSAYWVGIIAALQTLPVLLFSLFGGIIIDRTKKRNILTITQTSQMILAFILAGLTIAHMVSPQYIAILSFLLGMCVAIDMPARQTFIHSIVNDKDISSAVSLNAGVYNAARIIGPALAGLLISFVGIGGAFMLNGLSFLAFIIGLYTMKLNETVVNHTVHPITAIKEGLSFAFKHPVIRPLLFLATINSIFGWSYITIMPILAKDIFKQGPQGLGYLQSAAGFGAVISAITVSAFSRKLMPRYFVFGGSLLFLIAMFALSFIHEFTMGTFMFFFMGLGLLAAFATINSTIQRMSNDIVRGRVMSIYTFMFVGTSPFGSLEIGYLTQHLGVMNALRINAIIMAGALLGMWLLVRRTLKL